MSTAAIANGGGVAAGSTVAILQSAGAAGLTASGTAAVGTGGAAVAGGGAAVAKAVGGFIGRFLPKRKSSKPTEELAASDELKKIIDEFGQENSNITWVLSQFEDGDRRSLVMVAQGNGDVMQMCGHLVDTRVMYGLLKVTEGEKVKVIFIHW